MTGSCQDSQPFCAWLMFVLTLSILSACVIVIYGGFA